MTAISLQVTYSKTSFLCVCVSVTLIYNCLFYILENILIQVLKSSSETMSDPNVYHLEISDDRTYPTAYDACQTILEKECLQDPFICGNQSPFIAISALTLKFDIIDHHSCRIIAISNGIIGVCAVRNLPFTTGYFALILTQTHCPGIYFKIY